MRHADRSFGIARINQLRAGLAKRNGDQGDLVKLADLLPDKFFYEKFDANPVVIQTTGEVADGTSGDVQAMRCSRNLFELVYLGTQTLLSPSLVAAGLDVSLDAADDEGCEITMGITSRSKAAFTVGTDPAFYAKLKFTITDVSDTDDCLFGFRKAEAYQAAVDDYDEMAAFNVNAGDITLETILNAGNTTTTDTTDDWADGGQHTLEILVSDAGVVTYKIDGDTPTVTAAFTFDDAEVVVPYFSFLHAAASTAGIIFDEIEVGLQ